MTNTKSWNLLVLRDGSDEVKLIVVDDSLFQEIIDYDPKTENGRFDSIKFCDNAFRLLYGEDGELTGKNPRVFKSISTQTFCLEETDLPQVKRIYTLPDY